MVARGQEHMALACLLAADAYLRPGELLWLESQDIVAGQAGFSSRFAIASLLLFPSERGRTSKTQVFNDSVLLDTRGREWMVQMVIDLAKKRKGLSLFAFNYSQWQAELKRAAQELGIKAWEVTLYLLRHTGPSDDFLAKRRSLEEIQRRGRWAVPSSVRRYEKSSKVAAQLRKLSPRQLDFCRSCEKHLACIFQGLQECPSLAGIRQS